MGGTLHPAHVTAQAALRAGRFAEAAAAFEDALAANDQDIAAWIGLADAQIQAQRLDAAEGPARRALMLAPLDPAAVRTLAGLLQLQARHDEGLALADAVLARDAAHAEGWIARADSLANLGRYEEALAAYRTVVARGQASSSVLLRVGLMLRALGRPDAMSAFDAAVALDPDAPRPRYQRGLFRLATRDFAGGWGDYEARWQVESFLASSRGFVPRPMVEALATRITADDVVGKRVVVVGEQGLGDQVMFASMIPDLARAASEVRFVCDPRLVKLFSASLPNVIVADPRGAQVDTDTIDLLLAVGSLGHAFRRSEAAFPGAAYLTPDAGLRARWAERLGPRRGRLRIGLAWRGGVPATGRAARSLNLDQLAPLLDLPGCEFVSLQHGDVSAEIAGRGITAFPPADLHDMADLAALAAELDVVVSVQTTLAHLCGAIGRRGLVLLPHNAEWRYGASGERMPWYGALRLFRQRDPGDWRPVVQDVAKTLQRGPFRDRAGEA